MCAREDKGLSLADVTRLGGMDRSALSKLETGQRPHPTIETQMPASWKLTPRNREQTGPGQRAAKTP
jgi:hypothetical protein